ncbi:predicted protein [Streptomyces iranensis]|uniref:Uncharacterized protein n=1 Tax=Streptomyces iranensis TaxID=576784 RepID=A0A060ZQS9_9ACTN|nr:predicted protein [Streptomyces iranensis]
MWAIIVGVVLGLTRVQMGAMRWMAQEQQSMT